MNKKRLTQIITAVSMLLLLSGCSTSANLISLETKFSDVMNEGFFTAIITFPLSQAINWLFNLTNNIFVSVTLVTVIINLIVLAFTFKSTASMQKMQELQPELNKIQAKYEGRDDQMSQQRMAQEMQQLYAKYGINPIGSLLSTFIQFPLLIGMYNAVRKSEAVAHSTFLGANLSLTPKEGIANKEWVLLVIFVLMIIIQFISMKITQWLAEYRGKKEADKHHKTYQKPVQQNAMMPYTMLIMVGFAMLSCPTALSLYYLISSAINILKTIAVDALMHKEGK